MRRGNFDTHRRHRIGFKQDWNSYKNGFGDKEDEFYLGNEHIHALTSRDPEVVLRVELESFDGDFIAFDYYKFRVTGEDDGYRLIIGEPMGSLPVRDIAFSLVNHNGSRFSTPDRNLSGNQRENCPEKYSAGFWFDSVKCWYTLLTAPYFDRTGERKHWEGIQWSSWKRGEHLKAVQLKIRSKKV
jgi:hypothetical protein